MSSSTLIRLGGLAAVGAGVLLVISEIFNLTIDFDNLRLEVTTGSWFLGTFAFLIGTVLLLGALVGLYLNQAENMGALGLAGFLVAFLGTALLVGSAWSDFFFTPSLVGEAPQVLSDEEPPEWLNFGFALSAGIASLGWLLFGVAALRARVYPRASAILLIAGAVLAFFPLPLSTLVINATVAWLGFILLTGGGEAIERPARVS